jgi:hypothetical protein
LRTSNVCGSRGEHPTSRKFISQFSILNSQFALALLLSTTSLHAAPPVRPPVVQYTIDVKLDPAAKKLTGRERLVWRNPSNDTVGELQFHLYLNAFRNRDSLFMRESGGRLRSDRFGSSGSEFGWIEIRSMRRSDGEVLTKAMRFIHPDSKEGDDRTVVSVPLTRPVPPRGEITLDIEFEAKLPSIFARTGFVRDFFLVGQWFPKIGVYEPAGMRHRPKGGWNTHQFHGDSEFYADFGDYDVTIRTPERFKVGATGNEVSTKNAGGWSERRFVQRDVHDFAWTADPRYVVQRVRFDPSRDVPEEWIAESSRLLGLPHSRLQLRPVEVTILMQPDHAGQWERTRDITLASLAWCGLRFGAYPYQTLTVVDPPEDARGASGMEYPTFFTGGTLRAANLPGFRNIRYPETIVAHEFIHQYFYGMVGSNEFEEPWLDEGITSYVERQLMDRVFAGRPYSIPLAGVGVSSRAFGRAENVKYVGRDPIVRRAWEFSNSRSYALNSYAIPATALLQIEGELGEALFARSLRAYFEEWSFRHPDTHDFFATFSRVSGRDLTRFRDGMFFGRKKLDLSVDSVDGKREVDGFRTTVFTRREGTMPLAAEVQFVFADGSRKRGVIRPWAARTKFDLRSHSRLVEVRIDPLGRNVWDSNFINNSWSEPSRTRMSRLKMTARFAGMFGRIFGLFGRIL